jgi:hypothetical protein
MNCPKCNGEFHCGCGSCKERNTAKGLVVSVPDGDLETCGHCGLTMRSDEWLHVEMEQYKKSLPAGANTPNGEKEGEGK